MFLLTAALLLSNFAPWAITPLLALGGAYLCFEGAEKVFHILFPHADSEVAEDFDTKDSAHLEEEKVAGAIKTDFILAAEIMTIALASISESNFSAKHSASWRPSSSRTRTQITSWEWMIAAGSVT